MFRYARAMIGVYRFETSINQGSSFHFGSDVSSVTRLRNDCGRQKISEDCPFNISRVLKKNFMATAEIWPRLMDLQNLALAPTLNSNRLRWSEEALRLHQEIPFRYTSFFESGSGLCMN